MNWRDANDFFSMGGYALYVWGAYGVMLVLMVAEPVLVSLRHRAARAAVADEIDADPDDGPARRAGGADATDAASGRAALETNAAEARP
jgi:heme exporter protein D